MKIGYNKQAMAITKKEIRTIFIGTTDFSEAVLDTLVQDGYSIVLVVAQPDRPSGRKKELLPTPIHAYCMTNELPYFAPERMKEHIDEILSNQPDLIVTCAYGQIVPKAILEAPKYGCLNVHPSLLPKYRGGAPMHHAIWAGDDKTGVCLMEMVEQMDAGKVYARKELEIGQDETLAELTVRLKEASSKLIQEALPKYLDGELIGQEQNEEDVVIARNISKEDEQVHFAKEELHELYNHIRAMIDWPISYGLLEGKRVKFYKARIQKKEIEETPGTILGLQDQAMEIACMGGILKVYVLQMEGKMKMDAETFFHGLGRNLIGKQFD